jgi:hypothetical protein
VLQIWQNWQGTFSRATIHICDIAETTPQEHIEEPLCQYPLNQNFVKNKNVWSEPCECHSQNKDHFCDHE